MTKVENGYANGKSKIYHSNSAFMTIKNFYNHLRGFVVRRDAIVGRDVVVGREVVVRRVDFSFPGCAFDEWIFQGFLQLRQID